MDWSINFTEKARKQLKKLDKEVNSRIIKYLETRIKKNPRSFGSRLLGELSDFWRYRVGDYRVIVSIEDNELIVLVIDVEHRSKVYKVKG